MEKNEKTFIYNIDMWLIKRQISEPSTLAAFHLQKHVFLPSSFCTKRETTFLATLDLRCSVFTEPNHVATSPKRQIGWGKESRLVSFCGPEWCNRNQKAECKNSASTRNSSFVKTQKLDFLKVTMFFPPWWITHLGNVFFALSKKTDTRTLNQISQTSICQQISS